VPATPESGGGFAVEIFVNEVEMTATGAGFGMDPYDLLVPAGRLSAGSEPVQRPVARCGCGVYGCGSTDVVILRESDTVRWEWRYDAPINRDCEFDATEYDEEIRRAEQDASRETPERTAARAVWKELPDGKLRDELRLSSVIDDYRNPEQFVASLMYRDTHQVFGYFPWSGREPGDLAQDVIQTLLAHPLDAWNAAWHSITRDGGPPEIAGLAFRSSRQSRLPDPAFLVGQVAGSPTAERDPEQRAAQGRRPAPIPSTRCANGDPKHRSRSREPQHRGPGGTRREQPHTPTRCGSQLLAAPGPPGIRRSAPEKR
jgi:hypothetical protein